ncbi:MAG: Crp/Fnr family transcriptional regulator [Hyphomonadaceae bacterium]|nr:Crp/Fnr family transcriptional regulator [Hyphomonadaceae bacterium]
MTSPIDFSISKFSDFVDATVLDEFRAVATKRKLKRGAGIEVRGERARTMYFIEDGLVQLGLESADGSTFNLTRLGAGHTFGEIGIFQDRVVIHDSHAATDVSLLSLSHDQVFKFMSRSPSFGQALLRVAYMRLHTTLRYIGDSLNTTLEARTAKLIWSIHEATDPAENIIQCRQIDLAHGLGVSRVSIGKSLKSLSQRGLIKVGYGKIEIISKSNLKEFIRETHVEF